MIRLSYVTMTPIVHLRRHTCIGHPGQKGEAQGG
jgi:hypothetical protein